MDDIYYFLTEDRLGVRLEEAYTNFFTDAYVESTGWPNADDFSQSYAAINSLDDERLEAISKGLNLWIDEMGAISDRQEDDMSRLADMLEKLEVVGEVEQEFLKRATPATIANMRAINEISKEYAGFIDSTKDLVVEGEPFTFTGFYAMQIRKSKEAIDSRIEDLNDSVNSNSKSDGKLGQEILELLSKKRKRLVAKFDRIADPELLKAFELSDENFLDAESGIEVRIEFYEGIGCLS